MTMPADSAYPLRRQRRALSIFAGMIAVSLLLHLAAAVILSLPGRFSQTGGAPVIFELQNLLEAPAPLEPSIEEEPVAEQQPVPVEEAVPAPVSESAKLEQAVESSLQKAAQTPDAVHESAIGLGMVSGHFASFAEGATLKDDIRVYYFALMRRINEVWWTSGAAKGYFGNAAEVRLIISREGKLLACELLRSSGSREQDKALLAAISAADPLPPLPQSYPLPTFNAPVRFVPPLRLMFPGFGGKGRSGIKSGE
jgi:periplasmic protein TonB